jgi:hypothetical protein
MKQMMLVATASGAVAPSMRQTVQGAAQVQISRKYLAHFVECPLLTCISLGEKLPLLAAKLVPARPPKAPQFCSPRLAAPL